MNKEKGYNFKCASAGVDYSLDKDYVCLSIITKPSLSKAMEQGVAYRAHAIQFYDIEAKILISIFDELTDELIKNIDEIYGLKKESYDNLRKANYWRAKYNGAVRKNKVQTNKVRR